MLKRIKALNHATLCAGISTLCTVYLVYIVFEMLDNLFYYYWTEILQPLSPQQADILLVCAFVIFVNTSNRNLKCGKEWNDPSRLKRGQQVCERARATTEVKPIDFRWAVSHLR